MWKMKGLGKWEEVELVEMIDMLAGVGAEEPGFAGRLTRPRAAGASLSLASPALLYTRGTTGAHDGSHRVSS